MTPKEQEKLRKILSAKIKALESELEGFATKNPIIKDDYQAHFHKSDPSDTSDEKARDITDYEEERAVEQNLELSLREAKETLEKVEKGTYGVCDKCLSPINQKRLNVMPAARLCISCAKKINPIWI